MIRWLSDALVEHRRPALVVGVGLAVVSVALAPTYPIVVFPAVGGALIVLLVLGIAMGWRFNRRPPDEFAASIGGGSFRTPDLGVAVIFWLVGLQMFVMFAGFAAEEARNGRSPMVGLLGAALAAALQASLWRAAWRGNGITLRPEGIEARKGAGTLHIPWDALSSTAALPGDTPAEITLDYARPHLVSTTGVIPSRATVSFEGVNSRFVLAAIRYFAAHPDRRYAIGVAGEAEQLRASLATESERAEPSEPPPTRRTITVRVITGVVLFGVALGLKFADDAYPILDQLSLLPMFAAADRIISAVRGARARRRSALP